ncbi:dihydrodipicolinate synthase family protein [Rhodospirillaceae bacterium SYSU D60014]|uniref:dihydrodipicolinate synthase family protein n=1 Tax=Virgifigura deserti TaxID=2268457 RepID=UPI000E6751D3
MIQAKSGFQGVYPMVYALFGPDGRLHREAMQHQLESMIAAGVHGVAVLGLASEANKLSFDERCMLMQWVVEDLRGRRPLAVTVAEPSIDGQIAFVREAAALGAQWVILQPPPVKAVPDLELVRFFGSVADQVPVPVAIQNAPEYLGVGLSAEGLKSLNRQHPNVKILKLETTAIAVRRILDVTEGAYDVFNGRGGIEIIDTLRAGGVGIIPGGESFDWLTRIFDLMSSGDTAKQDQAERLYHELLPMLVFLMDSIDNFLVYGKRVLGHRLGIPETDVRPPLTPPTTFGLSMAKLYADRLGRAP